jgi:hypothetical protein
VWAGFSFSKKPRSARAPAGPRPIADCGKPIPFAHAMIHHICFFKLKPGVTFETLETLMRETRARLLKIREVLALKCGKPIDPTCPWGFFLAVDVESTDKLALYNEDAVYIKYVEEILKPHTCAHLVQDFEMEPRKDVRYS